MPWTIYRYILWELLKLLAISAAVLVTVISFAAAIKPLSEGLLGPAGLLKFIFYSGPTMLGFGLPFAGAFASTLVFLRLASDNEIVACSVSGMSYRAILVPVLLLGAALTLGLFFLSNFAIPTFYKKANQTIQQDLMSVLVSRLKQKRSFIIDDYVLIADSAEQAAVTPQIAAGIDSPFPPTRQVELTRVVLGERDEQGRVRGEVTAQRAAVLLFRGDGQSWVTIRLRNAMYYDAVRGQLAFTEQYDLPPVRLPTPFRHSPKFMSWPELDRLRDCPERYDQVRDRKRHLRDGMAAERLRQLLIEALDPEGRAALMGPYPDDRYVIRTPTVRRIRNSLHLKATLDEAVVVEYESGGKPRLRFEADSATVTIDVGAGQIAPTVLVELRQLKVYDARLPQRTTEHLERSLPRLTWPGPVLDFQLGRMGVLEIYKRAGLAPYTASRSVERLRAALFREIRELGRKINARHHERAASAISCLLLLMLGAVLSIWLKGQMPLVVYFWSFMLAIVTLVTIYTGANIAGGLDFPLFLGLGVMWVGNVGLVVVAGAVYCRLARN